MKKLNIAIVCDSITHFFAGAFISTLRFVEMLSKEGYNVILISSKHHGESYLDNYKNIKIYRFYAIPIPKSEKNLCLSLPYIEYIKKVFENEKIDIVHAMIPTPLCITSVKAAKQLNIPVVFHSHTQPENWGPYIPKFINNLGIITPLTYRYIIRAYNNSDVVICPTKFSETILKKYGIKTKTKIISNGVDIKKFRKIKSSRRYAAKFGLVKDRKKLLFVGRLEAEKNVGLLIKAVPLIEKKFKNFEVCIVGNGRLKESLESLSKKLNVENKVKFLGRVSDKELVRIYNFCDIFVLPSFVELEGMVVLEAMSCGKPILISSCKTSASSCFVNENGLTFNPRSPRDLAEKSLKLLTKPKLLKKMSKKSYELRKIYDINKSIKSLETVYNSLKNNHS